VGGTAVGVAGTNTAVGATRLDPIASEELPLSDELADAEPDGIVARQAASNPGVNAATTLARSKRRFTIM
jgi:hypothetical protein